MKPREDKVPSPHGNASPIEEDSHLPPAIAVDVIPFDDFDALSGLEVDFVGIFGNEVEQRVNVFRHILHHRTDYSRGFDVGRDQGQTERSVIV